jgi:hypothetical protein
VPEAVLITDAGLSGLAGLMAMQDLDLSCRRVRHCTLLRPVVLFAWLRVRGLMTMENTSMSFGFAALSSRATLM